VKRTVGRALRRAVGSAAAGTAALALLVCGCVFAALAGPALSLHTRTGALHQTLAGYPATTKTVQVSTTWGGFSEVLNGGEENQPLAAGTLVKTLNELGASLTATPLPLSSGAWASLSAVPLTVLGGEAPQARAGAPPKLEVAYRDPLTSYVRLVRGTLSGQQVPPGALAVAATEPTAARFGLHPGSRLTLAASPRPVTVVVTAIVSARSASSTFWQQDTALARPSLEADTLLSPFYWAGGLIADPDQFGAIQQILSGAGLGLQWEFPLRLGGLSADQAPGLYRALNRAATVTPVLKGELAPGAQALTVSSPLTRDLALFLGTQSSVQTVLLLLFVSLIVAGAVVILLAARMIADRREAELRVLRARGASLRQVAAVMLGGALVAAGPGALAGAGLAVALVPGGTTAGGWLLAAVAAAVALAGPPLIAAGQHRRPRPAGNPARISAAGAPGTGQSRRRLVAEVTAVAAALGGLIVVHDQGAASGPAGGADLYLAAMPVLVALPVVVIMLRLYPLAIRGVLAVSARGPGATGFLALSRAARSSLTGVLPAFALVLVLSLAAFAGMVSQGIARGETASSWQATGADAVIQPNGALITAAAMRAIRAVPGVRHATAVWNTGWSTPSGVQVTVTAVDPASYAALVADTPFPATPAARVGRATPGGVRAGTIVPVLASPSAAAALGRGPATLDETAAAGSIRVRVAGVVTATPAQPSGGIFVIMPLQTLPGSYGAPMPNALLVTGPGIDHAQLTATASRVVPGSTISFRSAVLATLAASPLQHGAGLIITLTIASAAALGLFIVILGLALGAAERRLTLARLAVMGFGRPAGLVVTEVMPGVLAAVVAAIVCAVALPSAVGPGIDLSVFTGTGAAVRLQPDALALALPAVTIAVLALAVLAAEARTLSRRDVCAQLRVD
jgi:putative ABC transport system permease protein